MTGSKLKLSKSVVNRAVNPLLSFAGPGPASEKWSLPDPLLVRIDDRAEQPVGLVDRPHRRPGLGV
jgi:hypothetical protein